MKRLLTAILFIILCIGLGACHRSENDNEYAGVPNPIATITMSDGSIMRFELDLQNAPNTVANFTSLSNIGFYDGLEFFRIKPNALIQSGCPNNNGTGTAGYTIRGEFSKNGFPNTLSHVRGTISMARKTGDENYDTASSQFFILARNCPEYDGSYAAFGIAMDEETLSTIKAINNRPVDADNVPMVRQIIKTIRVDTHGYELKLTTLNTAK